MEIKSDKFWLRLSRTALNESAAREYLRDPLSGGICVFAGTTRGTTRLETNGQEKTVETRHLEYDCYPEMALSEMRALATTAYGRWQIGRIVVYHRLGAVPVGEASVLIGVSSPHRNDSFVACRYLIDTLKETVPIWKKEYFHDGTTEWVGVPAIGDALDNSSQA